MTYVETPTPEAPKRPRRWWLLALLPVLVCAGALLYFVLRIPPGALHVAALNGDAAETKRLIARGCDVNELYDPPSADFPPISLITYRLFGWHPNYGRAMEDLASFASGDTPLHCAAHKGYVEVARILLDAGADVNAGRANEGTPLYYASWQGSPDMLKLLIERGADVNAPGPPEWFRPLSLAASSGHLENVRTLLDAGARIEGVNGVYPLKSPLVGAAEIGNDNIFFFLVERGARVEGTFSDGTNLLHHTYFSGIPANQKIRTYLISQGLDVNAADHNEGKTPLHHAAYGDLASVQALVDAGANVNAADKAGQTPLHLVLQYSSPPIRADIAAYLIRKGAKTDVPDEDGVLPIHRLAQWDDSWAKVTKAMIAAGTDFNARDAQGRTFLDQAYATHDKKLTAILEAAGAKSAKDLPTAAAKSTPPAP